MSINVARTEQPSENESVIATRARVRQRVRAVGVALVCSGLVAVAEIAIGILFRLHSVLSEGLHTLADMVDSGIAFWAVRRAADPPDKGHPFGHGKFESMAAMFEGIVIAATGVWICYGALAALVRGEFDPILNVAAISAMAAASLLYLGVSLWLMKQWRETRSPAVYAEAAHLRTHIFITAALFGGLLAARFRGWLWMDAVLALFVGLALLQTARGVLKTAWVQLTDAALSESELEEIVEVFRDFEREFVEIHRVRSRAAGVERHVDIHLVLKPATTVQQAHDLCDRIESTVEARFPDTALTIHVEPAGHASSGEVQVKKIYLG